MQKKPVQLYFVKWTTVLLLGTVFIIPEIAWAQADRWQQAVKYVMDIDMDVKKHQFKGSQTITYTNNSPDTLMKVFYHLYFNAFQPGSMMDVRSRNIMDPDPRVGDRISKLSETEIGYHQIESLKQDGKSLNFEVVGTILEVPLAQPLLPGKSTELTMEFNSQIPIQIRRSGRNNREGIAYSMAQWYPKLCEYDYQGWHANPYVGREFHGIWGDFDVTIRIAKDFIVAASGMPQRVDGKAKSLKGKDAQKAWRFVAENVHDFLWAADPDYVHKTFTRKDGLIMNFYYQPGEETEAWDLLPAIMDKAFDFINERYGQYPYPQYSFIQGGDGGMEYPMATLITGHRSLGSLVGVSVHELMHSWYQMVLGTNESLYAWMDEGFTSYASSKVMNYLKQEGMLGELKPVEFPHRGSYRGYQNIAQGGYEEALTTHSDHFITNTAYGVAAYSKGAIFLNQLEYIIGKEAFDKGMLRYFHTWKFKHPNDNDFIRIMEKVSGLELDWYREYWVNTTHTIDYGIKGIQEGPDNTTEVLLERKGVMPMPIDIKVTFKDGSEEIINIPLRIMRGAKAKESKDINYRVATDWPWTNQEYTLPLSIPSDNIKQIEIDPSRRLADLEKGNNLLQLQE